MHAERDRGGWHEVMVEAEAHGSGGPAPARTHEVGSRTRLLDASIGLVEDVRRDAVCRSTGREEFSPRFQVCLPYRGFFVWHVGREDVVGDANQVLYVTGGESYRLFEPLPSGYGELVITPAFDVLTDIAGTSESRLAAHPLFRGRSRRAKPDLQRLRSRFFYRTPDAPGADTLAAEQLVIALLRSALVEDAPCVDACPSTRRLIRRTKEFLEAEFANPIRLRQVGAAVGASPAYLTDVFRRVEGISLHQYVVQLRLARALVELPYAEDLATLALEIGFSSHSHFSAAFRRTFGCTPSQFRQATRSSRRPAHG